MNRSAQEALAGATFTSALVRILFGTIRQAALALKNRRQVTALAHLDDRLLKDIGLTRLDVVAALSSPLQHDPSRHLINVTGHQQMRSKPGKTQPALGLEAQGMGRLRRDAAVVTVKHTPAPC